MGLYERGNVMSNEERPNSLGWTDKSRSFADEYLIDKNATQAAIRAGYSAKTAKDIGCQNLAKLYIREYIDKKLMELSNKANVTATRILFELSKLAFYDARKLYDDDGKPIHISQLDDMTAGAITGVDIVTVGNDDVGYAEVMKIKVADKKAALELLGKNQKLWTDRIEHAGGIQFVPIDDTDKKL